MACGSGTLSVLGTAIAAVALAAQEVPDLSGTWTSQAAGGGRGRGGSTVASVGSGWGRSITIVQDSDTLTVEYVFFSRGDLQPALKFRYSLDGSPTTNTVLMGRGAQEQVSRAVWEGDRLVITTVHAFRDPEDGRPLTSEVRRTLSLRPSGSLVRPPSLLVETTTSGVLGGPPSTDRTIYTKG